MKNDVKQTNIEEKVLNAPNGLGMMILFIFLYIAAFIIFIASAAYETALPAIIAGIYVFFGWILFLGIKIVKPNEARVLTLFGKYYGTLKESGIFFVNPFTVSVNPLRSSVVTQTTAALMTAGASTAAADSSAANAASTSSAISLKAVTLNNKKQKINDELGNPIEVGIVVVWKVRDTAKAVFNVENYAEFVSIEADSTLRDVARLYPYDKSEDPDNDKSLRGSSAEVAEELRRELCKRVEIAGIDIIEARITNLAYAPEIAAAMLQRQQATAVIEARAKIVEGAVGMVQMALDKLSEDNICELDEERKAQMVSNLLVVLCGNKDAQPIVNSGSIY
ncbi:MAG: SPFH domain-containing protein [Oscillospiraceae bacterium]|nr:SPFH domain-containing protein [Oscillospiraceae bacterium]